MNHAASQAFSAARSNLLLDHFFFGRLALYLNPVQSTTLNPPTLAVDGKTMYYDPEFFLKLRSGLRKSAIAHEVMHCVLGHIFRRKGREPRTWNRACDYALNLILKDSGFEIGEKWLCDDAFKSMTAEEIYNILIDDKNNGGGKYGDGDPFDESMDAHDEGSDADLTSAAQEWKVVVAQTAIESKRRGAMPANLERTVEDIVSNVISWREVLQRFMTEAAREDYTWKRPNRMFVASGLYMPSMYSEAMGHMDCVIDTSGSIGKEQLEMFGGEIKAIVAAVRPSKLRVIYADAAVNHIDEFFQGDEIEFKMRGGGGTDFRPALAYAEKEPPVALAYLTDMHGRFPDAAPDYPVMWVATSDVVGPFGQTIKMEDK